MNSGTPKPAGLLEATSMRVGVWVGTTASLGKRVARAGLGSAATLGGLLRWPGRRPVIVRPKQSSPLTDSLPPNPCGTGCQPVGFQGLGASIESSEAPGHEPRTGAVVAQGYALETQPALVESHSAPAPREQMQVLATVEDPQSPMAPSHLAELQSDKENLLSELDKALHEAKEAASQANKMAGEVALLQSELVATQHKAEESADKEEQASSRLASQIKTLQEERDGLISDLEGTRSSLQEAADRENALKTRVDALESHLAVARCDLEAARAEATKLRSQLADAISRPSFVTSDASVEDKASAEDQPCSTACREEHVEAQDLSPVSPEEVRAAVFPDAAKKVVFTRARLELGSQTATTRASAARALGGIRHELSVRLLAAQVAHDPSPQVRQECIKALATLEMKQGLPAVERALTDPASSVRLAAVRGLYRLAGAQGAPALARMLSDGDDEVRRRAATCLGWLGGDESVGLLLPLLADGSVSVRLAVVEAMTNLRSWRAISPLIECLSDPDGSIQEAALRALQSTAGTRMSESFPTDEESRERLITRWRAWWRDADPCTRRASTAGSR